MADLSPSHCPNHTHWGAFSPKIATSNTCLTSLKIMQKVTAATTGEEDYYRVEGYSLALHCTKHRFSQKMP